MCRFNLSILLLGCLLLVGKLQAQTDDYKMAVDSMVMLMNNAEESKNIAEKQLLSDQFQSVLLRMLKEDGSFDYKIDSIPHVKALHSDDGLVKIFSWGIPTEKKDVYQYFCVVQHRASTQTRVSDVFVLEDTKDRVKLPEYETLKYPNWYGCLYYEMVEKHDDKKTYYTLIGSDFNNDISRKKYIDVLTFDRKGLPVFGAPIFRMDKKPQSRVVFEYTSQSVMLLRYYKDKDQIVFNYLYPIVEEKKNDKRYYVPDVSYDGLMFKLGAWIKVPNVEMKEE